jgi:hypothetical protein
MVPDAYRFRKADTVPASAVLAMRAGLFSPAHAAARLASALHTFIVRPDRQMQLPPAGRAFNDLGMGAALVLYTPG